MEISDPLDGGVGYAYLFEDTSGLDPAAGKDYVDYEFNLTNGPYKTGAYNPTNTSAGNGMNFGPRPETSFVETDNYRRGFTDRWYDNELRILRGGATGVDILDRHDDQFDAADVSCVRTQDTFRQRRRRLRRQHGWARARDPRLRRRQLGPARPAPARLLRRRRGQINTFLRVHPIPGVVDFFDYSEAGVGLTYENGVMTPGGVVSGTPPGGVPIDGQPDAVTGAGSARSTASSRWTVPRAGCRCRSDCSPTTPIPPTTSIYRDGNVVGQNPCTGDDEELYGASGPQLNSAVNNTDEAGRVMWGGGQYSNLFYQRSIYYEAPGHGRRPGAGWPRCRSRWNSHCGRSS